jgi:hypothetical protein
MTPNVAVVLVSLAVLLVGYMAQERAKLRASQAPQPVTYDQLRVALGRKLMLGLGAALAAALVCSFVASRTDLQVAATAYGVVWFFAYRCQIWARVVLLLLFGSGTLFAGVGLILSRPSESMAWGLIFLCQLLLFGLTRSPATAEYVREGFFNRATSK